MKGNRGLQTSGDRTVPPFFRVSARSPVGDRPSGSLAGGFTLMEVLIFGAIASFALLCVALLLNKPAQMQRLLTSSEIPREATHAMDALTNDLREAVPGSVQWDVSSATSPLAFAKPFVDPTSSTATVVALPVAYGYEGPDQGPGALVRVLGSTYSVVDSSAAPVFTTTSVLSPIDPPTLEAPLFHYDAELQVVMIDIHYHPQGKPPLRLVRRIALTK